MTDENENDQCSEQATHQAAQLIADNQATILNFWVDAVIDLIPNAEYQSRSELGDHLQNLLDDIVRALNAIGKDFTPEDIPKLEGFGLPSSLHGRERATMKGYTVGQVVHEYVILRRTLTNFCFEHGLHESTTVDVIAHVIEYASFAAVKEFVASILNIQQKLIGTLVHDVRTPLGVAVNYAELLSLDNVDKEQKERAVQTITKSLQRAGSMLEDLLDTVTMEGGQGLFMRFDEGDIDDALETICKEANRLYGESSIKANLTGHPVRGVFDVGLIVRTVENLISNAVKFGDKKTPVEVCLEDNDDHVTIRVHNHGDAIPKAHIDEIFLFFSTSDKRKNKSKGKTKSWGLGLSLIKTVVQKHGGEVILESTDEGGTTFGMTLRKHYRQTGENMSVLI